ncbi:MAG: hypothetical protein QXP60_07075 [Nitrososphaerota archaeon]
MKFKIFLLILLFLIQTIPIANSQEYYKLEAYPYPLEAGIVKGSGRYQKGSSVRIEAIENEGWVFNCWIIEKGESIMNLNGSNINPLYFYIYEDVKIKAYFLKFEEYFVKIIARANISYIDIKYPEKAEKGSYVSLVAPEIYEISDKERYVFSEWKGDVSSKYSKITIIANKSLNIIAGYIKEIKFIDNEWYKESEYLKLEAKPTLITNEEREIVEYWKIKSLNATVYYHNSSIPKRYLNDIEAFSKKQYLIKFYFEGKEESFKIYLENQTINAYPTNNTYEIWIDEGKILKAEFIEPTFYKLKTSKQLILKVDSPRIFYIKYEYVSPFITLLNFLYYFFTTSIFDQLHNYNPNIFYPIPELFFLNPTVIIISIISLKIINNKYKIYKIRKEYLEREKRKIETFEKLISTIEEKGIREFTEITTEIDIIRGIEKTVLVPEELIGLAKSQGFSNKTIIELAKYYAERKKQKEIEKAKIEEEKKKEEIKKEIEKKREEEFEKAIRILKGEEKGILEITNDFLSNFMNKFDTNYLRNYLKNVQYEIKFSDVNLLWNKEKYEEIINLIGEKSFAIIGKNCNIILQNALKETRISYNSADCKIGVESFKKIFPEEILSKSKSFDELINSIPLLKDYGIDTIVLYNIDFLNENEINKIIRAFNRIPQIKLMITSEIKEIPDIENIYLDTIKLKEEEYNWYVFLKALKDKNIILEEEVENKIVKYSKEFSNRIDIINEIIDKLNKGTIEEINNIISDIEKRKEEEIIKSFNPIEKEVYDWLINNKLATEEELQDYFFSKCIQLGYSRSKIYKMYNEFFDKLYKLGFKERIQKSLLEEALK